MNIIKKQMIILLFSTLLFSNCQEKIYDYSYGVWIKNSTTDTLYFKCGIDKINIGTSSYIDCVIPPNDTIFQHESGFGSFGTMEGTEPIQFFFNRYEHPLDTVHIYRNDSLKVVWSYLDKFESEEETHNFFNHDSWKIWIDGFAGNPRTKKGIIMFTIEESDLE